MDLFNTVCIAFGNPTLVRNTFHQVHSLFLTENFPRDVALMHWLPEDCQKLIASNCSPKNLHHIAMAQYRASNAEKKDAMLGKYLLAAGVTGKPQTMSWHTYLRQLLLTTRNNKIPENLMKLINQEWAAVNKAIAEQPGLDVKEKQKNIIHLAKFSVGICPSILEKLDDELRANKSIVKIAVRQDGKTLAFANQKLQRDPELVIDSIVQNIETLQRIIPKLSHTNFLRNYEALCNDIYPKLQQAGIESVPLPVPIGKVYESMIISAIKYHTGVMLALFQRIGRHPVFLDDTAFLIETVKINAMALQFLTDAAKNKFTIVMTAFWQNPMSLQYASVRLKTNICLIGLALSFVLIKTTIALSGVLGLLILLLIVSGVIIIIKWIEFHYIFQATQTTY